jgi:sugar phosphate isomerase/epimerase
LEGIVALNYAFMSFSCPQASLSEMLAMAKQYGYAGIEPRIAEGHAHGIEPECDMPARRAGLQQAQEAGVAICCVATSCRFADPDSAQRNIELARRCIDLAADVGAKRLRVFGGPLPDGFARDAAIKLVASSLTQIASQASERSVIVCMETHDHWCNPSHVAEVMSLVNHPSIAVNWDIMHPVRQGGASMDEAFNILRPWIQHVHLHDGLLRIDDVVLKPIGKGEIDHKRASELLASIHYTGYLSGEWIGWEPAEVHLPREIATMRSYE